MPFLGIVTFITDHWGWFALAGSAWALWARSEWRIHGDFADPAYQTRNKWLRREGWRKPFHALLERTLNTFTFVFTPLGEATDQHPKLKKYFNCQPFTAGAYGQVKLGIDAPDDVEIWREEICTKIQKNLLAAL